MVAAKIMELSTCILVEHIFPFLDRATHDSCRFLNKDIFQLSEHVSNPAWPSHGALPLQHEIACIAVAEHLLAVGCETGGVILVVRKTMKRFLLSGHTMAIVSIQFSPDETLLATGSVDGSIRLWRLLLRRDHNNDHGDDHHYARRRPRFWETPFCSMPTTSQRTPSLSPRAQTTKTGLLLQEHDCPSILLPNYHHKPIHSLVFDATSQHLISAADELTMFVWNTTTGDCEHQLRDRWEYPRSLRLSPNAQCLAMYGSNGSLRIYSSYLSSSSSNHYYNHDDARGGGGRTLDGGFPQLSEIQFSKDGQYLYGNSGEQVHEWDIASGERSSWHLENDQRTIVAVTMSPQCDTVARITCDGRLVTSAVSHSLNHRQISVSKPMATSSSAYPGQYVLKFTCDGRTIVTANCRLGILEFWDVSL